MDTKITPEEFKEEFERIPKLEESIKDAIQQYEEVYLAGNKLVFRFGDYDRVSEGIESFRENSKSFTTTITLKDYGETRHLEIEIPQNEAIFVRISGEKIHGLAMRGFKALPIGRKKLDLDFSFKDHPSISLQGEFYFSYEACSV